MTSSFAGEAARKQGGGGYQPEGPDEGASGPLNTYFVLLYGD